MILAVFLWLELKSSAVLQSTGQKNPSTTCTCFKTAALVLCEGGGFYLKPLWVSLNRFLSTVKSSAKTVLFCFPYVIISLRTKCVRQLCHLRKNLNSSFAFCKNSKKTGYFLCRCLCAETARQRGCRRLLGYCGN